MTKIISKTVLLKNIREFGSDFCIKENPNTNESFLFCNRCKKDIKNSQKSNVERHVNSSVHQFFKTPKTETQLSDKRQRFTEENLKYYLITNFNTNIT